MCSLYPVGGEAWVPFQIRIFYKINSYTGFLVAGTFRAAYHACQSQSRMAPKMDMPLAKAN